MRGASTAHIMAKPYVVVVGSDFSEHATHALRIALERAAEHDLAELHVVHATALAANAPVPAEALGLAQAPLLTLEEQRQALSRHLDAELEKTPRDVRARVRVFGHVVLGVPSLALVQLASELDAQLLVVGTHGLHGVARWLLGSVADGVVRQAHCPVLVIPPPAKTLSAPTIEPACPRCLEARARSGGNELWCEQHRERHGRRHTYYQADRTARETNLPLVVR